MGIYEGLKDAVSVAQKADNIELYKKLLDISAEALDLQNKLFQLQQENIQLKKKLEEEKEIVRHQDGPYITLSNDPMNIEYCSTCWGKDKRLIQYANDRCPVCKTRRNEHQQAIFV